MSEETPVRDEELLTVFIEEGLESLTPVPALLQQMAVDPANLQIVNSVFRPVHSVKGAFTCMGLRGIQSLAHAMENLLNDIRQQSLIPSTSVISLLVECTDELTAMLERAKRGQPEVASEARLQGLLDRLRVAGAAKVSAPVAVVVPVSAPLAAPPAEKAEPTAETEAKDQSKTIRVDQGILDSFMGLVGELIIATNAFGHLGRSLSEGNSATQVSRDLDASFRTIARIAETMEGRVLAIRMVPVRTLFQRFPRLVREVSRKTGKQVNLVLEGEDTLIDKSIADDLVDPLVHLLRNSIDHGIESPEQRRQLGKAETGSITLKACHRTTYEGQFICIEVLDDGRGLDAELLLRKAVEKGLVSAARATCMQRKEVLELIFVPGFSTKDTASDISGRGVGMDVVRTNLQKVKGHALLDSEPGRGTTIRLEAPLTLALVVMDALLVGVNDVLFAIPLEFVMEVLKIGPRQVKRLLDKRAVTLRGEVIGVETLSCLFGLADDKRAAEGTLQVIILKAGNKKLGVIVDTVHRQQKIVIKPLADYLSDLPGVGGASILEDGKTILIIDPTELIELVTDAHAPAALASVTGGELVKETA